MSDQSSMSETSRMKLHKAGCAAVDNHHVCDGTTFAPCDCGADQEIEAKGDIGGAAVLKEKNE